MSRRSLDQAAARKTFALVAAAFALKPLGFCYLALRIGSGAVRPMPAGSRKVKGEPKSPQTAEPPPAEPARPAEPSQQAEPVRPPAEEVPVPATPPGPRERGRERRREDRHERSSSVRSVKGGKGKEKGKGKSKGKTKEKSKRDDWSRAWEDEGHGTPRSAMSAPVMNSYQNTMYGSWYAPDVAAGYPQGPTTGWYQDWQRQWWYWSGTNWWISPSTTTSRTVESPEKGGGSGKDEKDKKERRSRKEPKRSPPVKQEPKAMKKPKPDPPGGDDGGSSFSEDYDEEEPEEEDGTNDPSVAPSLDRARERQRPRTPERGPRRRREDSDAGTTSTARTAEIQEMLQAQVKKTNQERNKPSISQVKLEAFRGSRSHFKDWKKVLEAQQALYRLDEHELAMLVYLSCEGEARQILNQMEVSEMQEPAGG